jgi:hypothetical protein
MFYPGRAQGKLGTTEVTSDVIDVYIARSSAHAIKYLLEASTENLHRPLDVVPRDFKYHQPDIYAKLLSTQNDYLAKHRIIGLVAIPIDAMHHQKVHFAYPFTCRLLVDDSLDSSLFRIHNCYFFLIFHSFNTLLLFNAMMLAAQIHQPVAK